jgi:hypothetical protein
MSIPEAGDACPSIHERKLRLTVENQLRELHRIAERRGWEVVQEYRVTRA